MPSHVCEQVGFLLQHVEILTIEIVDVIPILTENRAEKDTAFCSSGGSAFATLSTTLYFFILVSFISTHHWQLIASSAHCHSLYFQMYIVLLSPFTSASLCLSALLCASLLTVSSIHLSFHCLSLFLPLSPLSLCVCPPQTFALHNYFSAFTCSRPTTAIMILIPGTENLKILPASRVLSESINTLGWVPHRHAVLY